MNKSYFHAMNGYTFRRSNSTTFNLHPLSMGIDFVKKRSRLGRASSSLSGQEVSPLRIYGRNKHERLPVLGQFFMTRLNYTQSDARDGIGRASIFEMIPYHGFETSVVKDLLFEI